MSATGAGQLTLGLFFPYMSKTTPLLMTQNLRCVVVDDEPLAIEVIVSYLNQFDHLELVHSFQNPIKAFEFIRNNTIDVLFMDIQMPMLTGLDILRSLPTKPKVIITTAYRDYALEGFELEVVDYLLKPISLERFVKAIAKVRIDRVPPPLTSVPAQEEAEMIFFKVDKKMVKVNLDEVLYIESQRDYLRIVRCGEEVITRLGITEAEEIFPSEKFIRVHRSFIVARNKITSYSQTEIELEDHTVPIGRSYRPGVSKELNRLAKMGN